MKNGIGTTKKKKKRKNNLLSWNHAHRNIRGFLNFALHLPFLIHIIGTYARTYFTSYYPPMYKYINTYIVYYV